MKCSKLSKNKRTTAAKTYRERYKNQNIRLKNKIRKLTKHVKKFIKDVQSTSILNKLKLGK